MGLWTGEDDDAGRGKVGNTAGTVLWAAMNAGKPLGQFAPKLLK